MFCPNCGNMAMERVEVTVGPDGAEYFGVRKKHCLKGTRFSLPKPKVRFKCFRVAGSLKTCYLIDAPRFANLVVFHVHSHSFP